MPVLHRDAKVLSGRGSCSNAAYILRHTGFLPTSSRCAQPLFIFSRSSAAVPFVAKPSHRRRHHQPADLPGSWRPFAHSARGGFSGNAGFKPRRAAHPHGRAGRGRVGCHSHAAGDCAACGSVSLAAPVVAALPAQAGDDGVQHAQGRAAGLDCRHALRRAGAGLFPARPQAGNLRPDSSAAFCWPPRSWPRPVLMPCCATATACATRRLLWAWRPRANCACWAAAAATASMWSASRRVQAACARRLGLPPDAPVVGFVGRLTRDKGLPELMEAFDAILAAKPDAHLLLVGWFDAAEDALSHDLRSRIKKHPRIHLTGFVARHRALLPRDGRDGSAHLARGLSECRSGGRGHRDSGCDHSFHWLPRRRGAGGDRAADSARLPGCHSRGRAAIAAQPGAPLPHGRQRAPGFSTTTSMGTFWA